MTKQLVSGAAVLAFLSACGQRECKLDDPGSCPTDQVCEQVQGEAGSKPLCFSPVTLGGKVFDLTTNGGIAGAVVLATDENGSPAGAAVTTDSNGDYTLRVPSTRTDTKGTFVSRRVLLRSQAKNYLPFPSGSRLSLPVETAAATRSEERKPYLLETPQTDIGLSPVEANAKDLPSISGTVEMSAGQKSVLLVLEGGSGLGRTALASADGAFTFFNVPSGTWKLAAYSAGANYTARDVPVSTSDVKDVEVKKASTSTATLSGSVQLVAGANNDGTSVVLVVDSTFIETLGRGEVPPGLRAPEPGTAPNVTGGWSISGIPDGRYVVLAAFENDGNVRDPDPGISGTQLQRITVANGAISGAASPAFKVTAAVELVSPGRDAVDDTSATPTFTWAVHSNAEAYGLKVFDTLGREVWTTNLGDKAIATATYAGPALTSGQYYQWRVTAFRRGAPTSQTEELRGLFRVK